MNVRRHKISACALLAVMAFLICLTGCSTKKENAQPSGSEVKDHRTGPNVEAEFQKAKLSWSDEKGRSLMDAEFKKAKASHSDVTSAATLIDVKAVLYADGKPAAVLTAPSVETDNTTREIRASGGVKVVSISQNATIEAENIVWKSSEGKLIGSGGVSMIKKNISGKASGFEADTTLRHVRLKDASIEVTGK